MSRCASAVRAGTLSHGGDFAAVTLREGDDVMGKVYELRVPNDHWEVSPIALLRTEYDLRAMHRERDTIGVTVEERFLMLRALSAIASGHEEPKALAEAAILLIDRAATGQ